MQDKLRKYIEEHSEELDVYQPREHLWEGIDERLQNNRRRMLWQRLAIAASVLLVITAGTWAFIASQSNSRVPEHMVYDQPPIKETEVYYTAIVQMKDAELEQYCKPQPELCKEFERDIAMLNKAYYQLKTEYAASADKKRVLSAMRNNLQMQVQLISRQLQIMETVTQKKEQVKFI
ncbi:MAG: hypothetical protein EOP56_07040 [Sphingobacteriales bacterium]|nr:MAG: hypothetical protein EOP56_07040 [Sphingobacteriales bacterium]